jgi:hypothetical protein
MIPSLREAARLLDGDVSGGQILCPGPGHSRRDRSLSVRVISTDRFIVHSFTGDDWRLCRDHVRERLGLCRETLARRPAEARRRPPSPQPEDGDDHEQKTASAHALWRGSVDPRGTPVETYLRSRNLDLGDDIAGEVLRWNPRISAMIALFRSVRTDAPQAVSRTFLDREGRKTGRKFLAPVAGATIKLDPDENVLGGLHIGEGVETCLAARQFGLRPAWALGSKGAIARFPVLSGIEALTIFAEPDAEKEVAACAARWDAAGREALINRAIGGKDLNDALRAGP